MSVHLNWRRRSLAIGAVFLVVAQPGHTADLLTPAVNMALAAQWTDGAESAIEALKAYGSARNVKATLPILRAGRDIRTKLLYETAASTLGDDFWRLAATYNSGDPSCEATGPLIVAQFATDLQSLAATSPTYRDDGALAALAVLLKWAPAPPSATLNFSSPPDR